MAYEIEIPHIENRILYITYPRPKAETDQAADCFVIKSPEKEMQEVYF